MCHKESAPHLESLQGNINCLPLWVCLFLQSGLQRQEMLTVSLDRSHLINHWLLPLALRPGCGAGLSALEAQDMGVHTLPF